MSVHNKIFFNGSVHNKLIDGDKQVAKEALRMASVVQWFPRVALEDCEIEGTSQLHMNSLFLFMYNLEETSRICMP